MLRLLAPAALGTLLAFQAAQAIEIYPVDRASILIGSTFDFKVEFDGVVDPDSVRVTVNGIGYEEALGAGS